MTEEELTRENFSELTAKIVSTLDFKHGKEPDGKLVVIKNLPSINYDWRVEKRGRFIFKMNLECVLPHFVWDYIKNLGLTENTKVYATRCKNKVSSVRRGLNSKLILAGVEPCDIDPHVSEDYGLAWRAD